MVLLIMMLSHGWFVSFSIQMGGPFFLLEYLAKVC